MTSAQAAPNPTPLHPAAGDAGRAWSQWDPARCLAVVGLCVLAVFACYRAWADILHIALRDEEASQVLLVPPIFAWLLWTRRSDLQQAVPRFTAWGLPFIILGWGLSALGFFQSIQVFWHAGAVIVLVGAIITTVGPEAIGRMAPAVIVLGFLIPVPGSIRQQIAIPMQTYTATASVFIFKLLGQDITQSGSVLIYNGVDVAVAEACNGMRMVFALLLVTFAFAFVTPLQPWMRGVILLLSPLAAIACNVLRLIPTVYVHGHYPAWGTTVHDLSAWLMLGVAFLVLMGIVRLLEWAEIPVMQPLPPAASKPSTQTSTA